MSPYLVFLIVILPAMALVLGAVYAKFGNGLATKIFWTLIPLEAFGGFLAFVMGVENRLWIYVVLTSSGAAVISLVLYFAYRFVVVRLQGFAQEILASATELGASANQTASVAAEQSAAVNQVSATVAELRETSKAAESFANQVRGTSVDVQAKGELGVRGMDEARDVLQLIGQVAEIVDAVQGFANQSNLLSVNARVEAAKAGEQGRGFAVVAAEIRNLAEQSKESAQRVAKAVGRAEQGRRALEDAAGRMRDLLGALNVNADSAQQIAATMGQQSAGIQQIAEAIASIAEGGVMSAATARQVAAAVDRLNRTASQLEKFVTGDRG